MADVKHFTDLLEKIAKEQKLNKLDIKIEEIFSGGANYTSKIYRVQIKNQNEDLRLFAKVAAFQRSRGPKYYDTEILAYTKLVDIYYELQDNSDIPEEDKLFFPKFYGHNPNRGQETIVIEDLTVQGYKSFNRFNSVDWPYASVAIAELAKTHALSMALEVRYPEKFRELTSVMKFDFDINSEAMAAYTKAMMDKAVTITRENNRERMRAYKEWFKPNSFTECYTVAKTRVLCHGDYRPSNLMYRARDDGKIEIKIVDLQTLQGGSPVLDLIYFIFTGSDEQFRAKHYDQLIDHYYTQLSLAMTRLGLNPETTYSREDFDYELKEKLPFGLSIAIFALPVVTVEAENAPKVNEDLEISAFSVEKTSDLYTERLNGIVNDYIKWGILT